MVWTDITRPRYERHGGRYASDCSDKEWAFIEPFMPLCKANGRPRITNLRDVWDAIQYMASTGCQSLPGRRCKASLRGAHDPQRLSTIHHSTALFL